MTDPHPRWVDPNPPTENNARTTTILAASGVLLTVVVVAALIAVVLSATSREARTGDVFLVAANAPSDQAFTRSVLVMPVAISDLARQRTAALLQQIPVRSDRGVRPVSGHQSELYGATGDIAPCDVVTLANQLDADPATAEAWGLTLGLSPGQIPYYLNTLTPVVLTLDTWVTTHAWSEDGPLSNQTVLQAGNAVLIDQVGVPRVHCATGNPLTPPANANLNDYRVEGDEWPGFAPQNVIAVTYATPENNSRAAEFTLLDVVTGEPVVRAVTASIELGGTSVPLPDPAVMNVPPNRSSGTGTSPVAGGSSNTGHASLVPETSVMPTRLGDPPPKPPPPLALPPPPAPAPYEPIRNCGTIPVMPNLVLINYNVDAISCPDALDVIARFHQAQQKYATVDDWDCGILGAAEAERMAHVVNCRGPRGELRAEEP
ncbi:DUF6777 domain-containing protein [Mycolicibacterium confluentis]|uniref:Uncharacterized protein n=1 Tax=Mycolicibacterium confluentis TaxID=28047 RepID=A0A7I7Y2R0_9MYCO|nr:DUF6777 domain-containing protein [Mycolicibacterium confluentis]MCV7322917.1 hypothetical protein [Mycolicibacterium confluentis]ORV20678.1 hypothetical protein AWB99_06920 [Mycolicibacterium confluentis]BBZ35917.1 hypothetical protein MCNF_45220 [Mycolicibacterium confluentis]